MNKRNKLWLILTLQMAADLGRIREALVRRVEAVIRSVHQLGSDLFLVHASDGILTELQSLYQVVGRLSLVYGEQAGLLRCITSTIDLLVNHSAEGTVEDMETVQGSRGRPSYFISEDQLRYFVDNGFSVPQISRLLTVSISTIKRRLRQYEISIEGSYTQIEEDELLRRIQALKQSNPTSGYRMIYAALKQEGIKVPVHRVRKCCFRVDPGGTVSRWMMAVERRQYSVPGPNSLWHIDGNHKLIRYTY